MKRKKGIEKRKEERERKETLAEAGKERGKKGAPKAPDLSKEEIRATRSSEFSF